MKNLVPADDAHLKKNDKKKKRKPILNPDEENLEEEGSHGKMNTDREHDLLENDVNDKEKRKKKSKMSHDRSDRKPENGENGDFRELVEKKVEELKTLSATPAADSNPKSSGEKRKKTKRSSDASAGNAVELETEAFQEGITKKSRESVTVEASIKDVLVNSDSKSKDKKKKKDKTKTEDGNAVELETEAFQEGIKKKSKESVTLETSIKDVLVNADSKSKDKKKKKDKTKIEDGETSHDAEAGDATVSIKDVSEDIINKSKKSKKRNNLASEERASEPENVVEAKDSKLVRLEGTEDTTVSKNQKKEKSYENFSKTVKTSYNQNIYLLIEQKESPGSCDSPKQSKEHLLANGDLEKGSEGGTSSKMFKKEKHSTEAHPSLIETERKDLCKLIDCQKLSQEASNYAAQNDRLPVQMAIRVLYF